LRSDHQTSEFSVTNVGHAATPESRPVGPLLRLPFATDAIMSSAAHLRNPPIRVYRRCDCSWDATFRLVYSGHMGDVRAKRIVYGLESTSVVVEIPEVVVHEGDEPDALAHLRDTHVLPSKHLAEFT
jgi:hypothetical protein